MSPTKDGRATTINGAYQYLCRLSEQNLQDLVIIGWKNWLYKGELRVSSGANGEIAPELPMKTEIEIAPPSSLILIMDKSIGILPEKMAGNLVKATESCIAVGTMSEVDGSTRISLETGVSTVSDSYQLVFQGQIATPNHCVHVCTVLNDTLLQLEVAGPKTTVKIWANHASEPDKILIGAEANI